tara:strand:- start:701 stop:1432 length:732 start_codon:yes stop_codon:yes gene_type:complete
MEHNITNKSNNLRHGAHKFGISQNHSKKFRTNNSILNLFFILFSILLLILIIKTSYYLYIDECNKIDLGPYLFSLTLNPCDKKSKDLVRTITREKEVFHISDQIYTYDEAKCKCKNYGGRLATKKELIKAYNNGANWCSYGWCEDGYAFFPVQSDYFELIQSLPGDQKYCGNPGINGGVFDTNMRFGINCFGIKPKGSFIPLSTEDNENDQNLCEIDGVKERVQAKGSDNISSFSNNKWSFYD